MVSLSTHNIKISAETFYQSELSKPAVNEFLFTYRITIENNSEFTIKLLKRAWLIINGYGGEKLMEGEGVLGKQPVIEPNMFHRYVSGVHLKTEIGKMSGIYYMQKTRDDKILEVKIPEFKLVAPFKLN